MNRKHNTRDFGLGGPPGKGDKSRVADRAAYDRNVLEIAGLNSGDKTGFRQKGGKLIKKYV